MDIVSNLVELAEDESKDTALEEASKLQSALKTLTIVGSKQEIQYATFLLARVDQGIQEVYDGR